ncbi:MAG: DUF512 domain-containing protein [Clostridia bacterium]|nr:DUF512 domain-containing protein [Clostridia bacterium]
MVKITGVDSKSYAEKAGIKPSDELISINGNEINDVLDYRFYLAERSVTLVLRSPSEEYTVTVKKGEYDDIGLSFETPLMDKKHTCKNGCVFCFIDQNPKGLRDTIYFKDDDSRLSFIHGNYITLTNMNDKDVERIVKMRFSPINVSIHTTNPDLRVRMMKNKRAGEVLKYLDTFKEAGLDIRGQIVLCRGINDGEELKRTLADLERFYPSLSSVSVVPAGLTKHREGLFPLSDFTKDEAKEVIGAVEEIACRCLERYGTRIFFAADELYQKAELELPSEEYYEEYPQLENGVGMLRSFIEDVNIAKDDCQKPERMRKISVATGAAAYPTICDTCRELEEKYANLQITVYKIINNFYGESITVSGLLTGKDMLEQLKNKELYDELLIPVQALRHPELDFLCGMTLEELEAALGVKVTPTGETGFDFVDAVLGV